MKQIYHLHAKHRPHLLWAMMQALAGRDARISFEGRLSHTSLVRIKGARFEENEVLRRETVHPQLDFLVLPLTRVSLPSLALEALKIAFGDCAGTIHVQIENHGKIAFAVYDLFHEDCAVAYPGVPLALLDELVEKGALRSYKIAQLS
jgi:hypothetical protein